MINIVGGTYKEYCFEPFWEETYGSGLRACLAVLSQDKSQLVQYHTFADHQTAQFLEALQRQFENFTVEIRQAQLTPAFYYDYPLSIPRIQPRLDTLEKSEREIDIEAEYVIAYGLLEGNAKIQAKKAVYDPQSPVNPQLFSATGSIAEELVVVTNFSEARIMSGHREITAIKDFFFDHENAHAIIIKMGAQGAYLFTRDGYNTIIPVYETKYVWPIGSGDIFVANFAYHWFSGKGLKEAATEASLSTAAYCNSRAIIPSYEIDKSAFSPLVITGKPSKQIYLAGPFFTFVDRWLIDQIRTAMRDMKLNVFSPLHDVGHGLAEDVVHKDIEAIENSGLLFAVLDGLDSGTLFEVGYAVARNIPVIAYLQNETKESIKMLEGTNCIIESDLATAVYKAYWTLAKNE